jgi:Fe2+ or Zn2+ uptake regulation protein
VLEVDLVLRVHELVVAGERLEAELVAQSSVFRLICAGRRRADGVHARELVDVAAEAVRRVGVALHEEPLELRPDDRDEPRLA